LAITTVNCSCSNGGKSAAINTATTSMHTGPMRYQPNHIAKVQVRFLNPLARWTFPIPDRRENLLLSDAEGARLGGEFVTGRTADQGE